MGFAFPPILVYNTQQEATRVKKLKVYLDSSVISHLDAPDTPDKMADTLLFWKDLLKGKYEVFLSPVVISELRETNEPKLSFMLEQLRALDFKLLAPSEEVTALADEYLRQGVLTAKSVDDCMHIAYAVVYQCDIIVSWNFRHLVNYRTIDRVRIVNAINRYREISIVSPTMMLEEDSK